MLKFNENTETKRYNEFLSENWLQNNDFILALIMIVHLVMTLFIVSLVKAESSAVNYLFSIAFVSPWVIATLFSLAVAIQTLGMSGVVYLVKNNKDITTMWAIMFFGIILRPIEWFLGSEMIKEQS
jgi:hypothetical protein